MSYVVKLEKCEGGTLNNIIRQRDSHEWQTFLEGKRALVFVERDILTKI